MIGFEDFLAPPDAEREALVLGLTETIFMQVEADRERHEAQCREASPPAPSDPPLRAFLLLDASRSPDIFPCVQGFPSPARCLLDGERRDDLEEVAPWLVEIDRYADVWEWFVEEGYGKDWGIMIHSRLQILQLERRLRSLLRMTDEDGRSYFFKFYRPQHLNAFLPTFGPGLVAAFLGAVHGYCAEDAASPAILQRHWRDGQGRYRTARVDLKKLGAPLRKPTASADGVEAYLRAAREDVLGN